MNAADLKHAALAACVGLFLSSGAACAQAPSPAPTSLAEAVVQVADKVCRPAADAQASVDGFAAAAGYVRETTPPPNLPVGSTALTTWRAPSPEGRVYVISGLFPESTSAATCLVAVYGAKADGLTQRIGDYVLGLKRGFVINRSYAITTRTLHFTRYDRRVGDTVHSVMVMEAIDPKPEEPTEVLSSFTIDRGWAMRPGHPHR